MEFLQDAACWSLNLGFAILKALEDKTFWQQRDSFWKNKADFAFGEEKNLGKDWKPWSIASCGLL